MSRDKNEETNGVTITLKKSSIIPYIPGDRNQHEMLVDEPPTALLEADQQPTILDDIDTDSLYSSIDYESELRESSKDVEPLLPTTILDDDAISHGITTTGSSSQNCFWRYKPYLKGPPGVKYEIEVKSQVNGHKPLTFKDPAIDYAGIAGSQLACKYRLGEGNDITPSPAKLTRLGQELQTVQQQMTLAGNIKHDGKMIKRKLISRQCRLKRSASHEANKIIFDGLEKEREELSRTIRLLKARIKNQDSHTHLTDYCKTLKKRHVTTVAGETDQYVNDVLEKYDETENNDSAVEFDSDSDSDSKT